MFSEDFNAFVRPKLVENRGCLITFEGLDGAGKSSHLAASVEFLRASGLEVVQTREPGGTDFAEKIRAHLLDPAQKIGLKTEILLMFAARQMHLEELILPALNRGAWVLCDRFTDSTFAFQGGGRQVPWYVLSALERWVHADFQPDLTLLFDVAPELAATRRSSNDRIEAEDFAFHKRVREAYLARAASDPERFVLLDAAKSLAEVGEDVRAILQQFLANVGENANICSENA